MNIKQYIKNIFIWIDQGINTIILFGYPDETLSSRFYRWYRDDKCKYPMIILDKIAMLLGDKNHCYNSYLSEELNRQLPPEFRK